MDAPAARTDRVEPVTDRQREVARLIAEDKSNREIADALGISLDGAKYHVSELLGRLGLARREDVGAWYREHYGWRTRLRALFALPLLPLLLGGGAVAAVVVVAVVVVAWGNGGAASEEPGRLVAPEGEVEIFPLPASDSPNRAGHVLALPDGRVLVAQLFLEEGSDDASLLLLNPRTGDWEEVDAPHQMGWSDLPAVLPDGRVVFTQRTTSSYGPGFLFFDPATGTLDDHSTLRTRAPQVFAVDGGGTIWYLAYLSQFRPEGVSLLYRFDPSSGVVTSQGEVQAGDLGSTTGVSLPDGRVAFVNAEAVVVVAPDGSTSRIDLGAAEPGVTARVTPLPDGNLLLTGGSEPAAFEEYQASVRAWGERYAEALAAGEDPPPLHREVGAWDRVVLVDLARGEARRLPSMEIERTGHHAFPTADGRVLLVGGLLGLGATDIGMARGVAPPAIHDLMTGKATPVEAPLAFVLAATKAGDRVLLFGIDGTEPAGMALALWTPPAP